MSMGRGIHGARRWARAGRVVAVGCVTLLVATGCGDDDDDADPEATGAVATPAPAVETTAAETTPAETGPDSTGSDTTGADGTSPDGTAPGDTAPAPASAATGEGAPVEVTLTETSIDGLPTELTAGLVDVTVTDETEAAGAEINFTRVEPGTDQEAFVAGLVPIFDGGPFPDFFLNNAGVVGSSTIALDEGEYVLWIDLASNLERPSTADDIITAPLTVGPGEDGAQITDTDGTITSTDYAFSADVSPGASIITFKNDSANEFHHVILVDFGTNDPEVVESSMLEFLQSEEDAPPPEGIDMSQVNFDFAVSGVFGPGGSGTFAAPLEEGTTYAALCFIQDRAGGAPHAIQHEMFEVFQL